MAGSDKKPSLSKQCAFCGAPGPLTLEHIWPKGIIKRTQDYNARYFGKTGKFFAADLTIKDVCSTCNNGNLSVLDNYICGVYDRQFFRIVEPRKSVTFLYDYDLLLRWLLKISYNAARGNDSDGEILSRYADYILKGGPAPLNVSVFVETVRASKNPNYEPGTDSMKFIAPKSVRCGRGQLPEGQLPGLTLRFVAINSFYFWLLIDHEERLSLRGPAEIPDILKAQIPRVRLEPDAQKIQLSANQKNMLNVHKDWVLNPKAQASMAAFRLKKASG